MESRRPSLAFRALRGFARAVDGARRFTVNLIFLLVVAFVAALLLERGPRVPARAALVLDPEGTIVEQLAGDPGQRALGELTGEPVRQTLLRDLLVAVRTAKDDAHIGALYLDLSDLDHAGMTKLADLGAALDDFRASHKRVVAAADSYSQAAYYLAARADEVHLAPLGLVLLDGFGIFRPYYKEGLDKFDIEAHVFRVGEYKSAVEPYLRSDLSPEARESYLDVLGRLWTSYLEGVARGRRTTPAKLTEIVDRLDDRLRAAGGDAARMALAAGLVDHLSTRDEVRARLIQLVGADDSGHDFHRIGYQDYLAARGLAEPLRPSGDAVGVVMAAGSILDGQQPAGTVGGDSTSALVRQAREDDHVKAVVLRVDSPGGSAFASELIRRELALTRQAGKPVVVSMGSVAASGGYWISTASDQIWADPATITGSIGIFGVFPTFQKTLEKYLGVRVDGVGTTWLSGAARVDRALDPRVAAVLQNLIDRGYEEFLARVGEARKMDRDAVDRIGRGRIWTGAEAKDLGLVDQLGGLDGAIAAAGKLAKLGEHPPVRFIEKERSWRDRLVQKLLEAAVRVAPTRASAPRGPLSAGARVRSALADLESLADLDDPQGLLAYCFCAVDD
jgi:protease-4